MEYTDFGIARTKQNISPITADAVYYVTADSGYHIFHAPLRDSMVFIATLRGHGEILLHEKKLPMNEGDILLFDAASPFEYYCTNVSWTFWWFEFRCADSNFMTLPSETSLSVSLNDAMLYLCQESLNSLKLNDSKTASFLLASLLCLLQKENLNLSRPDKALDLFRQADRYIHDNLVSATVESTSRALHVSARTLLDVFRNLLGISTLEYIQNMKMDMACHLLTTGQATMREISELLGYADPFSFSKSFRRHFGISPREYRKENS